MAEVCSCDHRPVMWAHQDGIHDCYGDTIVACYQTVVTLYSARAAAVLVSHARSVCLLY